MNSTDPAPEDEAHHTIDGRRMVSGDLIRIPDPFGHVHEYQETGNGIYTVEAGSRQEEDAS